MIEMAVIARERSDEAIQTVAAAAFAWMASQGEREAFVRLRSNDDWLFPS